MAQENRISGDYIENHTLNNTVPADLYESLSRNMPIFYRFFCWCAGAQLNILKHFPTEWNKFFGTGTAVFMTGLFALLSSTYALIEVFRDQISGDYDIMFILPASIAWSLFIFFFDRFLVSSIDLKDSSWKKWALVGVRLILACLIGLIISRPLEFRICQKEIVEWLGDEKDKKIDAAKKHFATRRSDEERAGKIRIGNANPEITTLQEQIKALENQNTADELKIKTGMDTAADEAYGTGGSGKKGPGPVYKRRLQELQDLKSQLNIDRARRIAEIKALQTRIKNLQSLSDSTTKNIAAENKAKVSDIEKERDIRLKDIEVNFATSLLAQNRALEGLIESGGQRLMIYFITLLFVMLEIAPILVKLITNAGPYEDALADIEFQARTESLQRKDLSRQELNLNKSLLLQLARSQKEIMSDSIDRWREHEINRVHNEDFNQGENRIL